MILVLANAVRMFGELFVFAIIACAFMSWFASDPYSTAGKIYIALCKFTEPVMRPCRRLMNRFVNTGMIDFSPVIAVLLVQIVTSGLTRMLVAIYYITR